MRHTLQVLMLMALFANAPEMTFPPPFPAAMIVLMTDPPRPRLSWGSRRVRSAMRMHPDG